MRGLYSLNNTISDPPYFSLDTTFKQKKFKGNLQIKVKIFFSFSNKEYRLI
jgi:hypothetical protein